MATYLVLGTYTDKGRTGLLAEGGTSRDAETHKLFEEQLGGKVIHYGFLMGKYDFMLLVELADDASVVAPTLLGSAGGSFTVDILKVISPAELDAIVDKAQALKFRLAGG